jgi:type I restriction enzyme, S subunit
MNYEVLSDVAKIIMGQSPPSSTYNTVGEGLPFYQGKTDFGDMYPTPRVYCTEPSRIAEAGDILISVRAPVGPTNLSFERSAIGRGLSVIRAGKKLDRDFLLYFLRFYEPELAQAGTGSTFAAISREDLETIKIPLPPLPEQKRIASLLRRADRLRQLRWVAHELGDALLQSVFLEMFGDPGINPNKYEKAFLSDLEVDDGIKCGPFGTQLSKMEYKRVGVPLWGIKHVNKKFITPTHEFLSPAKAKELESYNLLPGDIVMTRKGTVGNCSVYPSSFSEGIMHSDLLRIRIDKAKINEIFLSAQLMFSSDIEHQISLISGGAVMEGINVGKLESIIVLVPPLIKQEEFAGVVRRVDAFRGMMSEAERQVDGLFDSLLSDAFSQHD